MTAKDWTKEELEILRERRLARIPVPLIAAELGRPVPATYARARMIGTRVMDRRVWTAAEILDLEARDDRREPIAAIAEALGRTETSVRWKLEELGRNGRVRRWTDDDDETLRAFAAAGRIDFAAAAVRFGRPETAVEARARELGLFRRLRVFWDAAAIEVLRNGVADLDTVADILGFPVDAVRGKARRLGLIEGSVRNDAGSVSEADLREALTAGDLAALAVRTGVSERALRRRATTLGLVVRSVKRRLRPELRETIVRAVAEGATPAEASRSLRRDVRTVTEVVREAGLVVEPARFERREGVKRPGFRFGSPKRATGPVVDMGDAVALFLAERGVTRERVDATEATIRALRRRGYAVVAEGGGFLVDGRTRLDDAAALALFAEARGVEMAA